MGIISNYFMPSLPVTEEKIVALEKQYRTTVLEPAGLAPLFAPFDSKVTISSRAGVSKPDRKIFETALARLHSTARLDECLFVTEEKTHLEKAREYGMLPIGFESSVPGIQSFSNWNDAPMILAESVAPGNMSNLTLSAAPALAHHELSEFKPTKIVGRFLHGRANQLFQLNDPRLGVLDGVYVERPADVAVELNLNGSVGEVQVTKPDSEDVADAINFVHTLIQSGQVAMHGESKGATHVVEKDGDGRRRLFRKRFSSR
jgi:hypothetical protein